MSDSQTYIHTPDQRLRVFVSSTLKELAEERAAVKDAISRLRLIPVLFELGARPHPPRDLYRAYLDQSHIFIGIYGREYGWTGPGMEISGLHDELLLSEGKPRLIYIKTVADRDERLQEMIDSIAGDAASSYQRFSTADELRDLVENDLAVLLSERFAAPEPSHGLRLKGLPATLASLVGREREVEEIADLLSQEGVRLITLSGPGGIGKSRLAVAVAERVAGSFPDGVAFIPLSEVRDPALAAPAIAGALGVHDSGVQPVLDTIAQAIQDKRLLLVLDNFEQVVGAAHIVSELLARAPHVRALVTSRRLLRLYGEHDYPVSPLEVADLEGATDPGPAVKLFVERAAWARPGFVLTPGNASVIVEICRRLDGMPLAIELAAARIRMMSPEALLKRLSDRLDLLSAGPRDLPERQQTMRNAIEWSYELLEEWEKDLFAQLSVFAGSFCADAVEAVCDISRLPEDHDTLSALAALAEHSLASFIQDAGDRPRMRMLEVVRDYARERLHEAGREEEFRARHVRHFTDLVTHAESALYTVGGETWMPTIQQDEDNIRAALAAVLASPPERGPDEPERPLLNITLAFYWYLRGQLTEGREWAERVLDRAALTGDDRDRANALLCAGSFAMWQGDMASARARLDESVGLWRRIGDDGQLAMALMVLGATAVNQGDAAAAGPALEEALPVFERERLDRNTSIVLMHLGNVAAQAEDFDEANRRFEEGLAIARRSDDGWMIASLLANLGEVARCQRRHDRARAFYEECLTLFEHQTAASDIARTVHNLAYCSLREGDPAAAARGVARARDAFRRIGNTRGVAECIIGLAAVDAESGDPARGAQLLAAGRRTLHEIAAQPWPADAREQDVTLEDLRAALGESLGEHLRAGESLSHDEALALIDIDATRV